MTTKLATHLARGIFLFVAILLMGCAGTPATYYYNLHVRNQQLLKQPIPVTIELQPFQIARTYDTLPIIYQDSPFRIQFYNYHMWSVRPGDMVTEAFYRFLTQSNAFRKVVLSTELHEPDWLLRGRINRICEWDDENQWFGWLDLDLTVLEARSEKVIYEGHFDLKIPAEQRTPLAVVKALSKAIEKAGEQFLTDLQAKTHQ